MGVMASQITSLAIVYSTVYWGAIKENSKALRHWPLCRDFIGDRRISAQMASNVENVSIWWRHHGLCLTEPLQLNQDDEDSTDSLKQFTYMVTQVEFWECYLYLASSNED